MGIHSSGHAEPCPALHGTWKARRFGATTGAKVHSSTGLAMACHEGNMGNVLQYGILVL
jgi:hypothetical protein